MMLGVVLNLISFDFVWQTLPNTAPMYGHTHTYHLDQVSGIFFSTALGITDFNIKWDRQYAISIFSFFSNGFLKFSQK